MYKYIIGSIVQEENKQKGERLDVGRHFKGGWWSCREGESSGSG
jgi:hypothetical protein